MKKITFLFFLLYGIQTTAQVEIQSLEDEIYIEVFGKCFSQLKTLDETKNRVRLNKIPFCSLYQCVHFVEYVEYEKKIQESILKRATEITTLLFNQGTPVYLISGMNASQHALEKNINLKDDHHLVYISIAECVSSPTLEKIEEIVNQQTMTLVNNSKNKFKPK